MDRTPLLPETSLLALQLVQGRGQAHRVTGEFGGAAVRLIFPVARQGELDQGAEGRRRQQHQQSQQGRGGQTEQQGRDAQEQQDLT